ncbi:MAG: hypothetical protein AABZ53_05875 [Planctomycetota bacterium]
MSTPSDDGTVGEGIFPSVPEHAVPDPLPIVEFKPWHLPRKQWVRCRQWAGSTASLLEGLEIRDRPLRYLGLPGSDLLDLEVLATACRTAARFRYLGLNSASRKPSDVTMQRIAENALLEIGTVDPQSIILSDDFSTLASKRSIAWSRVQEFESFDIVNLDLCDAFTSSGQKPIHLALRNVVEYQTNARTQPWLLFMTITADKRAIDDEELRSYSELLQANAAGSSTFDQSLRLLIDDGTVEPKDALSRLAGRGFAKLLALTVGKWLHGIIDGQPGWGLTLESSVYYRWGITDQRPATGAVADGGLLSAVYLMTRRPIPAIDESGLSGPPTLANGVMDRDSEFKTAIQMAKRVSTTVDLDCVLQNDHQLREKLVNESVLLLGSRNYDVNQYMAYAQRVRRVDC